MHWDAIEVKPAGNRTLAVKFADGLSGTIHLTPAYCTGVFSALLDDKLLDLASVYSGGPAELDRISVFLSDISTGV